MKSGEKAPVSLFIYSVFIRELRLVLASPLFYAAFLMFLVIGGMGSLNAIHSSGVVSLTPYFQLSPWLVMFLAISVSAPMLLKKPGYRDISLMIPNRMGSALAGKFLAGFLTVLLPLFSGYLLVIFINAADWGTPDKGIWLSGTIGLILAGISFFSLGLFISSFQKNITSTFIIGFMTAFFLWIPEFVADKAGESLHFVRYISINYHISRFSQGLIRIQDLAFFAGITALSVLLIGISLRMRSGKSFFRALNPVYTLLVVLIIVFVNLLAIKLDTSFDLTRDRLFSLDKSTKNTLSNLKVPVKAVFFSSSRLPSRLKHLRNDAITVLKQYGNVSSKFSWTVLDPDTDPAAKKLASDYRISEIEIGNYSHRKTNLERIFFGIAIVSGEKIETIPEAVNAVRSRTLEYELTFRIKRISSPEINILFSSGHREDSGDDLRAPFNKFFNNLKEFKLKRVNLTTDALDEGSALIIAGPQVTFSKNEIEKITKFMARGGGVLFFLDGLKMKWKKNISGIPMHWIINKTGLEELLEKRGITQNHDMILSFRAPKLPVNQHQTMTYPLMPFIDVNKKLMVVPYTVSSFSVKNEKDFKSVIKTTNEAWRHINVYEENRSWPVSKDRGPFITGLLSKGKEKFFVFGDSDILRDRGFDSVNTHVIFLRHFINEVLSDDSLSHLRFKGRGVVWISPSGKSLTWINTRVCFIPSILVILAGILYNFLRRRRKGAK
ncbi:Gldg family protein [Myxococcota bacterium]|nr:Gldg family protein [Myxococcota bacterium]MBU1382390.1 Gldg family protein [Myxococcota bacterium]MBU1499202.1 Gldg family protein [Myxococcota bacterium]